MRAGKLERHRVVGERRGIRRVARELARPSHEKRHNRERITRVTLRQVARDAQIGRALSALASVHKPGLPETPDPPRDVSWRGIVAGVQRGGVLRVLVDARMYGAALSRDLVREGYAVVTAGGGRDALRLARELLPVAITLDVMMPDLDGWTVLAAIKGDPVLADIPVILMTIVDERNRGY